MFAWVLWFALDSAFTYWVVCRGGADWLEGWRSAALVSWFAANWNAEQIRLYMLLLWICHAVWFVVGLFVPSLRA